MTEDVNFFSPRRLLPLGLAVQFPGGNSDFQHHRGSDLSWGWVHGTLHIHRYEQLGTDDGDRRCHYGSWRLSDHQEQALTGVALE